MKIVKFRINNQSDRDNVLTALANAGYKVVVKKEEGQYSWESDYYVFIEINNKSITD